ncbi:MAG: hypothetical protein IJU44_02745 [Kiritimatiellae bacterium]|nr:hypothetical protein [Kiritimatiellia bacterium]
MATGKVLKGKPYAENPRVRFDEGEVASAAMPRRGSLLYAGMREETVKAVLVASAAICVLVCSAAEWQVGANGMFSDGANWGGTAPAAGEELSFPGVADVWTSIENDTSLAYASASFGLGLFSFAGPLDVSGAVSIDAGGKSVVVKESGDWAVGSFIQVGLSANSDAVFTNKSGNVSFVNINLGQAAGAKGVFVHESGHLAGGNVANNIGGRLNTTLNDAEGVLEINGGTATFDRALLLGESANSIGRYFQRTAGAVKVNDWCRFGRGVGSYSEVVIAGGTFDIDNATHNPELYLAQGDNSKCVMTVADGAKFTSTYYVYCGNGTSADTTIVVTNNGSVSAKRMWLTAYNGGKSKNAHGRLELKDGGALNISENLYIGNGMQSSDTTIIDGGSITVGYLSIGNNGDSTIVLEKGVITAREVSTGERNVGSASITVNGGKFSISGMMEPGRGASKFCVIDLNNDGEIETGNVVKFGYDNVVCADMRINLNGGVFKTTGLVHNKGANNATINFNGGTLKVHGNRTGDVPDGKNAAGVASFIYHNVPTDAGRVVFKILEGGGTFDVSGNSYHVFIPVSSGVAEGKDGGLAIVSNPAGGTLTMTNSLSYTGPTTVKAGATLALADSGAEVSNALVLEAGATNTVASTLTFRSGASLSMEFSSVKGDSAIVASAGVTADVPVPVTYVADTAIRGSMTKTLIGGGSISEHGTGFRLVQATEGGVDTTRHLELRVEDGNLVIGKKGGTCLYIK